VIPADAADSHDAAAALLARMATTPAAWLSGDGPYPNIVLSSRVRLARNLKGFPFGNRASDVEKAQVVAETRAAAAAAASLPNGVYIDLEALSDIDRMLLFERHLISRELAGEEGARGVLVEPGERVSVLVNEEDHLRVQGIVPGYQLAAAWKAADRLDSEITESLTCAFSSQWGYLTACPTNVGTGMRASVLIHLPSLVLTKQISKVLQGIAQVGLAIRGIHGEGTEVMGNFFQVSNQTTLGLTEKEIIESLSRVTQQLIEREQEASRVLIRDARAEVEDKVFRAHGILASCRMISSDEMMGLASAVRLGLELGVLTHVPVGNLNRMLVLAQPAHLEKSSGLPGAASVRDQRRADLVRSLIGNGAHP
jgi:protein arginine kinase